MLQEPILVTGASGMLGRSWAAALGARKLDYRITSRRELDLQSKASIDSVLTPDYRTVINCAAWTDVDGAETDPRGADQANGHAVGYMADLCAKHNALFVTYSTDYVFSGQATKPYRVDQPRDPLNAYGRSKAVGEELLEKSGARHLLIRTSWVYAPWGKNFVRTIARAATQRESLKVVNDQRGRPTSAEHLAGASVRLIESNATGIYHVTDGGECTWFDFATEIARFANPRCRVDPCSSAEYPRPAKRPAYSVLDITQTEKLIGPMPSWKSNLADVLKRLEQPL